MTVKSLAHTGTEVTVDEAIRLDAAAHLERIYSEHVAAAEEIAAAEYRGTMRAMMRADALGD